MKKQTIKINGIPSIIWGETSECCVLAVHGSMSHKEDRIFELLAATAGSKGWQVLSFDLPEHGERQGSDVLCKPQNCAAELKEIMAYAQTHWQQLQLFAVSLGAYFSLLAYPDEALKQVLFLSPVVHMQHLLADMMLAAGVDSDNLKQRQIIPLDNGQILYWDVYTYVNEHPILTWAHPTMILYAEHDLLVKKADILSFNQKFPGKLTIYAEGEHFFHTSEQLKKAADWLFETLI